MINEDLRNQEKANQANENEREVTKVEKTTNEVQEMKNQTKGKVVIMDMKKVLEWAEAEFREFKKETSLFDQVEKFENLFGIDYKVEMMYSNCTDKRIKERILTKIINKSKKLKEIKEFIKVMKVEELKLNLLAGCYVVVVECKDFQGLRGLNIEAMWGSLGDILSENKQFNQDFISEELVNESIDSVISKLKGFGINELIEVGILNLDNYIEFTLKDLNLIDSELFGKEILSAAIEDLREAGIDVSEYECNLFMYRGWIITAMDEEELKETIWLDKFELI